MGKKTRNSSKRGKQKQKQNRSNNAPRPQAQNAGFAAAPVADEATARAAGLDDAGLAALRRHEATAAAGDLHMQYTLSASEHIVGIGPATEWLKMAAEGGHTDAQFNLARSHETGEGVPVDYGEAARWYRAAADRGSKEAQCNLGLLYCKGRGVEQSYENARVWLEKAAAQGDRLAACELGQVRVALAAQSLGCKAGWSGREY